MFTKSNENEKEMTAARARTWAGVSQLIDKCCCCCMTWLRLPQIFVDGSSESFARLFMYIQICFYFLIQFVLPRFLCFLDGYHHVTMTGRLFEIFQCQTFYQVCEIFNLTQACRFNIMKVCQSTLSSSLCAVSDIFCCPSRSSRRAVKRSRLCLHLLCNPNILYFVICSGVAFSAGVLSMNKETPSPSALYPTFPFYFLICPDFARSSVTVTKQCEFSSLTHLMPGWKANFGQWIPTCLKERLIQIRFNFSFFFVCSISPRSCFTKNRRKTGRWLFRQRQRERQLLQRRGRRSSCAWFKRSEKETQEQNWFAKR